MDVARQAHHLDTLHLGKHGRSLRNSLLHTLIPSDPGRTHSQADKVNAHQTYYLLLAPYEVVIMMLTYKMMARR